MSMNKEIWELMKKVIDEYVERESLLKTLLNEKEDEIVDLLKKQELDELIKKF